ncbi:MAG: MarP family serine protease [Solirubrobacterales bacterium]|nr:MarP family serine protease [Solirubrobacterales bacterium]MBV9804687.1 MarP family serine protease [Solirubrobacterales bacterium]
MTLVDWLIVAFTVLLAMYGYAQGFIVGALSLLGFAIGAFLGTRLAPLILPGGSHSQYAPLFGLLGALLAGAVLASGFEGLGARARMFLRLPGLRLMDGVLGAALTASVALGIAWIVGAIAFQSTGSLVLKQDIQRSAILRGLDELLPPAGPILHALAHIDPLPSVRGPAADVSPPPPGIARAPGVKAAGRSVVKVLGTACGLGIEGSGWVAAPHLVVTNAHVVAGESDTQVQVDGNPPGLDADVIDFDPRDDVAVLRVPTLNQPTLAMARNPQSGTPAAILGYPLDGGFDVEPGRIGQTELVSTEDAYGNGPVMRSITALRGRVRPGNSGGPMIDRTGRVVATVFAAITGSPTGDGGFAVPNELISTQLAKARRQAHSVPTGPCAG